MVHITRGEDFFRPAHRIVFDALVDMHNSNKPVDLVTLSEELTRRKLLDKAGGVDRLVALAEGVPSTASCEYYARIVRDKALLRHLIAAASRGAGSSPPARRASSGATASSR